jgi:hypothetical protein
MLTQALVLHAQALIKRMHTKRVYGLKRHDEVKAHEMELAMFRARIDAFRAAPTLKKNEQTYGKLIALLSCYLLFLLFQR